VDTFLALVVSGAVSGAIYSLVASGLTLSYSATGIFNFSYGAVAFSSAYLYYIFHTGLHWPIVWAALIVIGGFAPLLGIVLDAAVFKPLARANESAKIMATVGLLLAIPALTEWIMDGIINIFSVHLPTSTTVLQVGFPAGLGPVPQKTWHIPPHIPITSNELVVVISAAICAFGLWFLMRRTPLGLQMRAVVDRHSLARIRGVNDAKTSRYAWVIGNVLAALAGVVAAPIIGAISTSGYTSIMIVASAAAVIGGLRSIPLTFVGGLVLGVIQNLVAGYIKVNISGFADSVPIVVLIIALLVLARDRSRRGGSAADDSPPLEYLSLIPIWRRAAPWVVATAFLVVYVLFLANDFWAGTIAQGLALSLIFLSFVVVTGMGGMVSLAQATFSTMAGLTTGLLFNQYGVPFFAAIAIALVVTALLGLIVALPALRLGGLPLALATLALALLGDNVLFQWNWFDNNTTGWTIPRPKIGPLDLTSNRTMAISLLVLALVIMVLIHNLKRSTWGRSIAAVRSSEIAASTSGVAPLRVKLGLFALSAVIAGLGGICYVSFQSSVSNSTTPAIDGLLWLATVVLFGIRRPAAAVLAGIVSAATPVILQSGFHWWSWVPSWLSWNGTQSTQIPLILFGLGAVGLSRDPDGFLSQTSRRNHVRRMRRAALRAASAGGGPQAAVGPGTLPDDAAAGDLATGTAAALDVELASAEEAIMAEATAVSAEVRRHEEELVSSGAINAPSDVGDQPPGILTIRGLRVAYGDVEVLHGIDLSIATGQITGLFGVNGSGKSTLCSTVAGLVPVTQGSIMLDGVDITRMHAYRRVGQGILVAPESRGVFPGLTVEENLVLRLDADNRADVYQRFPLLKQRRRLLAGSLSGGEQQMLALAPVLVRPPKVVIADEPTLGLAPMVIAQVLDVFRELRDLGTTILLVEEKIRDVLQVADRAAFIELGRIVWSGERGSLDDEQLVGAYLGAKL
jgi:ABC-type branched-subunit amino acid transport system ATPase component/branched-subunit amino acid ABC-type transport system permease component